MKTVPQFCLLEVQQQQTWTGLEPQASAILGKLKSASIAFVDFRLVAAFRWAITPVVRLWLR